LHYVLQNNIEVFVDDNLVNELRRVLEYPRMKKFLNLDTSAYVSFIKLISTNIKSNNFNIQSPDPEDNYLYDIALTANAKLLVTGETALLEWENAPVKAISLANFKKLF